jgi:hypothetical protein
MISRQVQIERELRAEGFDVQLGRAPDRRVLDLACSRIAELEAKVERLREALEFYALVENWEADIGIMADATHDKGTRARVALEEEA